MDIIIPAIAGALGNLSSDAVKAGYRKLKELLLRKSRDFQPDFLASALLYALITGDASGERLG